MVPAESILNLESKPLLLTKSRNTPSAAGLLQMLPRHTKRTAKGLVSAAVDGVGAAIDALIADPDEKRVPGLREIEGEVGVWRGGNWGGRRRNGGFRKWWLVEWQNCKFRGVAAAACNAFILDLVIEKCFWLWS